MNRLKRRVLSLVLVCTLILGLMPAYLSYAAASYALSRTYVSPSELPSNITVTADVSTFTAGEVYPSAINSSAVGKALSVVSSTDKTVVFKLPSDLTNDTYEIRIGDPSAPGGYYSVGNIIVESPSITSAAPLTNQPFGYDTITELTITGQYVNFQTGQTVVEVLSSNTVVQTPTITSITDNSTTRDVAFSLETGLGAGSYDVRVTTGDEVLTLAGAIVIRNAASISLGSALNINEGYSQVTVDVIGTNTGFSDQSIVTITNEDGEDMSAASGVNVVNTTNLSFTLLSGLAPGTYTLTVKTGVETASSIFTVGIPSAVIKDESKSSVITSLGRSGGTVNLKIVGTNTDFSTGTSTVNLLDGADNPVENAVSGITVDGATQITLTLDKNLTAGDYKLQVITGSQTVETGIFTITQPSITSVTYNSMVYKAGELGEGYPAFQVTIVGDVSSSFGPSSSVEIVGQSKVSSISSSDAQHLTFNIDEGLTTGNYQIKVDMDGDSGTTFDTFTTNEVPDFAFAVTSSSLDSISPNSIVNTVTSNKTITVTGVNTHFAMDGATINVAILNGSGQIVGEVNNIVISDNDTLSFDLKPTSISNEGLYSVQATVTKGSYSESVELNNALSVKASGISDITPGYVYEDELLSGKTLVVTGIQTNFDSNDVVTIDGSVVTGVTITDSTHMTVDIPSNLTAGGKDIAIIDGASTYASSFEIREARAMILDGYEVPIGYTGEIVTLTTSNINFNDNTPTVTLIHPNGNREGVTTTVENQDILTFNLPTGLIKGVYTVELTFATGEHSSLTLTDTFNITNRYSSLYFKVNDNVVSNLIGNQEENVTLAVFGTRLLGGNDEDVTSKATFTIADNSVATLSGNTLNLVDEGMTTITASYDDQTVVLNLTVQPLYSEIYIAVGDKATTNLTKNVGDGAVTLAVMGKPVTGGDAENITSKATLTRVSGTSTSLNNSTLSFVSEGSSVIRATYGDFTKDLNVTVNEVGANVPPSDGGSSSGGDGGGFPWWLFESSTEDEKEKVDHKKSIDTQKEYIKEEFEAGTIDTKKAVDLLNEVAKNMKQYLRNDEMTLDDGLETVKDIITWNADNLIKKDIEGKDTREVKDSILALTENLVEKSGSINATYKIINSNKITKALATAKETAKELKAQLKANGLTDLGANINERLVIKAQALEEVIVSEEVMEELTQNDFDLKVEANDVSFVLDTSKITENDITIIAREVANTTKYTSDNQVGTVYDLDVIGNDGSVEVHLPVPQDYEESERLTVYVYDEVNNEWTFIYSKIVDDKVIFTAPHFSIYTVMENKVTFDDVGENLDNDLNIEGARESIEVLAAKQVINGVGDKKFNPNGLVTRAEFAKMIIKAIGYEESAENIFSDVPDNAWYTDYVAQAKKTGIVNGVGNGKYAPLSNITRQQVIAMIARAYKYVKGSDLIGEDVTFMDKEEISNWAIEAIEGANYKGILPWTDTSLSPGINATRAESAVMIKRLLDIMK